MILLGIGSNLSSSFGDRYKNIDLAVSSLREYGIEIKNKSSYYETPSYPYKENPKFINIIVSIETKLPPVDLASVLMFIEESLERVRKEKNAPRTCDIDIIDYKSEIIDFKYKNQDFAVPHKKIMQRSFVLIPIKEIEPNWIHPEYKHHIDTLIENLSKEDKKSILKISKS